MAAEIRDVVVLGSGPGGYVAAVRAAQLGRQVTIIEQEALGGVCLNWGCIPTKALLKTAHLYREMQHAADYGLSSGEVRVNFPKVIQRSREVAAKLSQGVNFLMRKNKVEVVYGRGALKDNQQIEVTAQTGQRTTYQFRDIIIATGARPKVLPGMEVDGEVIHTSRTILASERQPQKLLVMGAGAIGIEFAYFFNALGARVTVVEMLPQILPVEDSEISENLRRALLKQGLEIKNNCTVSTLKRNGPGVEARLKTAEGEETWQGDSCLIAVGVSGNVEQLGLETTGIRLEKGYIAVDEYMRTNVPHYYAIGDVAGPPWLAHVASHEGLVAAEHLAGRKTHGMRYDNIPGCTYCVPQVASVGLSEKAAKELGLKYKVSKVPYSAIGKAIANGEPEGLIKAITDADTGELLGMHILHAEAVELISEAAVIRSHEGIAASVVETIHPHPTLSESIMEVLAVASGRPINT